MRVILIPPSIFAAQAASGQAAFVPHSHAFAVKLEPKRAGSKPVNGSGESTIAWKTAFWFVVRVSYCRRYLPQCRKRRWGDRFALPRRNERFASPHTPLDVSLEASVENRPVPTPQWRGHGVC